jgi:hypothetical protein
MKCRQNYHSKWRRGMLSFQHKLGVFSLAFFKKVYVMWEISPVPCKLAVFLKVIFQYCGAGAARNCIMLMGAGGLMFNMNGTILYNKFSQFNYFSYLHFPTVF